MHPPQDDADTHDDFKPKFQPEPRAGGNIEDTIRADISQHKVFVYMKARHSAQARYAYQQGLLHQGSLAKLDHAAPVVAVRA